ncbi:hypothetical protein LNQ03_10845 [Klebsiella pneumoniae subsp. pneumoniae]|nr:hypothetical protein [Klebsiella pneumoniae subsp. pneumoniae]
MTFSQGRYLTPGLSLRLAHNLYGTTAYRNRAGNITRNFGAYQNFNVLESWTCATTGQIDFRIMRDNTNANVCTGRPIPSGADATVVDGAVESAKFETASGAWSARATVTFTLP